MLVSKIAAAKRTERPFHLALPSVAPAPAIPSHTATDASAASSEISA